MIIKKPRPEDYGLSTESLQVYNSQKKNLFEKYCRCVLTRKVIIAISIILTLVFLIVNLSTGFNIDALGVIFGIILSCDFIYGIILFQTWDHYSTVDQWTRCTELGSHFAKKLIDYDLSSAVTMYELALFAHKQRRNGQNTDSVYEFSLVKVAFCGLVGYNKGLTKQDSQYVVFSNEYLSNAQFYPRIEEYEYSHMDEEFKMKYDRLMEEQKDNPPILKKELRITKKVSFYYPCSDMFLAMKGKRSGDYVDLDESYMTLRYKILEVINPTFEGDNEDNTFITIF